MRPSCYTARLKAGVGGPAANAEIVVDAGAIAVLDGKRMQRAKVSPPARSGCSTNASPAMAQPLSCNCDEWTANLRSRKLCLLPSDGEHALPTAFKAVVFDLLTALLDSWSAWDAAAGGNIAGRRWRERYLEMTYGSGAYQPYEMLVAEAAADAGIPPTASEALLAAWDTLSPWPEVPMVLTDLRARGLRLGIVTNCSIELGRRAANRCGVPFDAVVTAEAVGFYKPHPEPYRTVIAALGADVSDTLFVAGSSADVPGATGVGMRVVWHNRVGLTARPGPRPLREARTLDATLQGIVL